MASMAIHPGKIGLASPLVERLQAALHGGDRPRVVAAPLPAAPAQETTAGTDHVSGAKSGREEPSSAAGRGASAGHHSVAATTPEQNRLAELAASCLLGDTLAWEALVRHQQRRVYALCYRFTGSPTEAEDLTQEVFFKVYRNLRSFDPSKASFGVWLTTLTRNLLVDHYRRSRMERLSESLDQSTSGEEDGPTRAERLPDMRGGQERHVAGVELRAKIQAALTQVSPELREAVILRDLEDMDYRDIAETLRIPQGTVKSRISRGRAELARLLKGLEGQVV